MNDGVVDAAFTPAEALAGVAPDCPRSVLDSLTLLRVSYPHEDGRCHEGQIVVHRALVGDVERVFEVIREIGMPIGSVIPMAAKQFALDGAWSDDLSMAANNSSGFNYRRIAGTDRWSAHAFGTAVDLNPRWNPMLSAGRVYPPNGTYDPQRPGTFTAGHPVVLEFERMGWQWGGRWKSPVDLHHFEKRSSA